MPTADTLTDDQYDAIITVIARVKTDERSLDTEEYAGMIVDALTRSRSGATGQPDGDPTWTFFGHWDEGDELVIEHAVVGEHRDLRPDAGGHSGGGLWCGPATGPTLDEAEQQVRSRYVDDSDDSREPR